MTNIKIHKDSNDQYKMTIKKGIGEGMDLDGAIVDQIIKSSDSIMIRVKSRSEQGESQN